MKLEEIEREKAKQRMESGVNQYSPVENFPQPEDKGKTRDKVAEKIRIGSGKNPNRSRERERIHR